MRILRLDLLAFGPFTHQHLDFGDGRGLHLVLGENEAGKSSTLRALRDFLFGIPPQSDDNFEHAYGALRIGATLANGQDSPRQFVRRKGQKNTLLEADGQTPASVAGFEALLGGLNPDLFGRLFGLGHEQLVAGGREIVSGNGAWGPILFAAGAGIGNLQAVQKQLDAEAAKLFAPQAKSRSVNARIAAVKDARKRMQDAQVPGSRWAGHDASLRQLRGTLAEVDAVLATARRSKRRAENALAALPLMVERRQLQENLAAHGELPALPAEFGQRRHRAQLQSTAEGKTVALHAERLAQLAAEVARLPLDEALAAEADRIDALREDLGAYLRDCNDTPRLEGERAQLQTDARQRLAELRPDLTLDDAERLRLTKSRQAEIQRLARNQQTLVDQLQRGQQDLAELQRKTARLRQKLAELPSSDNQSLPDVVGHWQSRGDLEQLRDDAQAELLAAQHQAEIDRSRLGLHAGSLEQIEKLPLPPPETIERCCRQSDEIEKQRAIQADKLSERQAEAAAVQQQIDRIRGEGNVPCEADLQTARHFRESGWQMVLADWQQGKSDLPTPIEIAAFVNRFASLELANAYAAAVQAADDVADALRRESDRVQQIASLADRQQTIQLAAQQLNEQQLQLDEQQFALQTSWQSLWQPCDIQPRPPGEMRSWLAQHERLVLQSQAIRKRRAALTELQSQIERGVDELHSALSAAGHQLPPVESSLRQLIQLAQASVRQAEQTARRREQLGKQIEDSQAVLQSHADTSQQATERLAAWQTDWLAAIAPLGLPADASPEQASAVLDQIKELFDKLNQIADKQQRLAGIADRGQAFESDIRQLANRLSPDLATGETATITQQLLTRLKQAAGNRQKLEQLTRQREECQAELDAATGRWNLAVAELQILCQQAGCQSAEDLLPAEQRWQRVVQTRDSLAVCEKQLRQLSDGLDLSEFVSETLQLDAAQLPDEIAALQEKIEQWEHQRLELAQRIGEENSELKRIDGNPSATSEAELMQQQLAALESEVEQYVRLRLANAVLRQAIERFRERNQGPTLDRAGAFFSQLTRGSFSGLQVDYETEQPVLVGLRGQPARRVQVNHMSEGTGDQLFLALRLAMLENHLAAHQPFPLVLDDILVNFDDARAAAALNVLAEFARTSQVIYFTHHQHLVRLAENQLGQQVQMHTLAKSA